MSHRPPRVRNARPVDAPELHRLQEEIYDEERWFVGDGPPPSPTLERRLRTLDPAQSLVLVADAGGELAGWLELHRLPARKLRHVATLTLAVARAWRGRGVGGELLGAGIDWARATGVRKVSLNVRAGNARAIALYRRYGFEIEGRERDQIRSGNGFEDNLIMARILIPSRFPVPLPEDR